MAFASFNTSNNFIANNVLATNTEGTPVQNTFPTTSTGLSLGMYQHLGIDGQGNKKTDFLNMSAGYTGGYNFWTSNSTQAPILLTSISEDGIKIDKSTNNGSLYNLPAVLAGQINQIVFQGPPYLDSYGIRFGVYDNPVQALFNSGPFEIGVIYYAQASNAQTLLIRTTTNPSDPVLDCSSFLYGQIAFAIVTGSTPVIITENLTGENLTFINSVYNSVLTSKDLTINDTLSLYKSKLTNIQLLIQDYGQSLSTIIDPSQITCDDSGTNNTIIGTNRVKISEPQNNSILTCQDLTFNNISILPYSTTFNFTVDNNPYSFPCISTSNQITMCSQSNFNITVTGTNIILTTQKNLNKNFLTANIFRDNTFYPLQVNFTTGNLIVLTGNFMDTQTIYFNGFIFI